LRAKRLTRVRIRHRRIARRTNYSRGPRRYRVTPLLERKHRDLETLAFFTNHVLLRHPHILQRKITRIPGANPKLSVNRARRKPLHAALDDETRHTGVI